MILIKFAPSYLLSEAECILKAFATTCKWMQHLQTGKCLHSTWNHSKICGVRDYPYRKEFTLRRSIFSRLLRVVSHDKGGKYLHARLISLGGVSNPLKRNAMLPGEFTLLTILSFLLKDLKGNYCKRKDSAVRAMPSESKFFPFRVSPPIWEGIYITGMQNLFCWSSLRLKKKQLSV